MSTTLTTTLRAEGLIAPREPLRIALEARDNEEFVRRISAYTEPGIHSDVALLAVVSILVGRPIVLLDASNLEFPDTWTIQQFIAEGLRDQPWVIGQPLSDRHLLIVYCDQHFEPVISDAPVTDLDLRPLWRIEDVWRRVQPFFMMEPPATPGWQSTRYRGVDGVWFAETLQTQQTRAVLRANCELPPPVIRALLANVYQLSWNGSKPSDADAHNPNTPNQACGDMYFANPVDLSRHVSTDFLRINVGQYYTSSKFDTLCVIVPCMYPNADGTSAEVITVAMRATRFVVFHATPQLPQRALDALSVLMRAWFGTVMRAFRDEELRHEETTRKRKDIIRDFREPSHDMEVITVPQLTARACTSVRGMALFYWAVDEVRAAGVVELPRDLERLVRCAVIACSLACFCRVAPLCLTFSQPDCRLKHSPRCNCAKSWHWTSAPAVG